MNKNANFWANVGANLSNLKALFAPPKWLKVFLGFVSVICVIGIIVAFALNTATKDKVYNANLTLHEQKIALDDKRNKINGEFSYTARIAFSSLAPLLRSSSISNVRVIKYAWDNAVDFNAFKGLTHSKRNVFFNSTQDLVALGLESLGIVEYRVDFSPLVWEILKYFVYIMIFVAWFIILRNSFKIYAWQVTPTHITRKDYAFLGFAFALCASICAFTFWLGFPGFHNISDIYINIALEKSNFAPVFISYILQVLYFFFGRHLYYLFLFNLIPFYLGIFFLIAGFYLRSKNPFALFLIFPTFIGNFYFENFIQHYSFSLSMLLFCLWALLLFIVLVPLDSSKTQKTISKILWIFLFMLMFFAILWRHNAIFSVFPAFFVIIYLWLQNHGLDSKTFIKRYIALTFLSAILCVIVAIFIPKILATHESYPENHTLLHQIAGACVPANDSSCFKDEWYREGKSFDDAKVVYLDNKTYADVILNVFKYGQKLDGLKTQWLKSILKHPLNFINHESNFVIDLWTKKGAFWSANAQEIQNKGHLQKTVQTPKGFPENEQKITFTPLKEKIYSFFYKYRIEIPHIISVCISAFVMIVCGWFLWQRRFSNITIFAFSAGFAGFWSAIFIALFIPVPVSRYMSPVFAISIIALTGFIALCFEIRAKRV